MGIGVIFYGIKRSVIGLDEFLVRCPRCNTHQWADVMVYSLYYHIYWIPIAPIEKEAFVVCHNCALKRDKESFDATLVNNYVEIKSKFKHPLHTYTGVTIFIIGVAILVIHSIIK